MKKFISLLLSAVMLISIAAGLSLSASAATSGDFEYRVLGDGTAEITNYTGSAADLVIPSELAGYTVTKIGYQAFEYNSFLKSVTIPKSISSIENRAFQGCAALEEITVDAGNEYFSSLDGVLFNIDKSKLIHYPGGNTRTTYSIPEGVKTIGEDAFGGNTLINDDGCSKFLEYITIPESLEIIEEYGFAGCSSLKEIKIPSGVKHIDAGAFWMSDKLTDIYIYSKDCTFNNQPEIGQLIPLTATIHGYKNSTAEKYAKTWEIKFVAIEEDIDTPSKEDGIIADGTDKTYVIGSGTGASIHCSYPLNEFISVTVNGELVDEVNYTLEEGSTILTFKSEYLDTLPVGDNVVALNFTSGTVQTILTIENSENAESGTNKPVTDSNNETTAGDTAERNESLKSPSTGAPSVLIAFAVMALAGSGTALVAKKKEEK